MDTSDRQTRDEQVDNSEIKKRVLILDDIKNMTDGLQKTFRQYNTGELEFEIAPPEGSASRWFFETEVAATRDRVCQSLNGDGPYDAYVIDRRFSDEYLNLRILETLRDLQIAGIRIIWTAHKQIEGESEGTDMIRCMRLGAWDYLDKREYRLSNTYEDVVFSTVEGLLSVQSSIYKERLKQDGNEFVLQYYEDIYECHKGHFLAFIRKDESWIIDPVAKQKTLLGLYLQLKDDNIDNAKVHITQILE